MTPSSSPFELVVIGSGGPRGFGRAASGYLIVVEGKPRVLVDVGPGAFIRLGELDVDFGALDTVLLTHLHIDHAGDLPGFVKSRDLSADGAAPMTFRIFGPTGAGLFPSTTVFVDRLFGESGAFAYLRSFRHELEMQVTDVKADAASPVQEILRDADLRVTAVTVDHDDVPALAYRVEHGGHAVVISGDLASKNDNLAKLAAGADLLVYDTAVVDPPATARALPKLYDLHTTPHRIGEIAAQAKVRALLLSHLPPNVIKDQEAVLASVKASYSGPTQLATDCLRVDLTR
jgi:ribonuclease BN (tRNA processing enzyme)